MQAPNSRIVTGLSVQAAALLIGYLSALWLYSIAWLAILVIAIPIFLIGVFLLMNSGGRLVWRLLLSFWPAAIPLGSLVFDRITAALQWRMVRTEVFLVPTDYRGSATVVFDDPNGIPPAREGKVAVFRIPPQGELHTRDHASVPHLAAANQAIDDRREFYFLDKAGGRTRIEPYRDGQPPDRPVVFWRTSYANFEPVRGVLEESRYLFYNFFVGTPAEEARPQW